jgi:hypothetical protein
VLPQPEAPAMGGVMAVQTPSTHCWLAEQGAPVLPQLDETVRPVQAPRMHCSPVRHETPVPQP